MERRGFPPYIIDVRRMAQTLIDQRGSEPPAKPIGKHWIYRFLRQHPQLNTHLARSYNAQRAKNEDPKIISEWFQRV
jgi:Tc5 transposase DNA-binding domain